MPICLGWSYHAKGSSASRPRPKFPNPPICRMPPTRMTPEATFDPCRLLFTPPPLKGVAADPPRRVFPALPFADVASLLWLACLSFSIIIRRPTVDDLGGGGTKFLGPLAPPPPPNPKEKLFAEEEAIEANTSEDPDDDMGGEIVDDVPNPSRRPPPPRFARCCCIAIIRRRICCC